MTRQGGTLTVRDPQNLVLIDRAGDSRSFCAGGLGGATCAIGSSEPRVTMRLGDRDGRVVSGLGGDLYGEDGDDVITGRDGSTAAADRT